MRPDSTGNRRPEYWSYLKASIVIFEDAQSAFWGAAEIRKSNDVSPDQIMIDTLILEASLFMESDMVAVEYSLIGRFDETSFFGA